MRRKRKEICLYIVLKELCDLSTGVQAVILIAEATAVVATTLTETCLAGSSNVQGTTDAHTLHVHSMTEAL